MNNLYNTQKQGSGKRLFIACDYEELKPETYNGIKVYNFDGTNDIIDKFNSKNILKDIESIFKKYSDCSITFSSSIDNYYMDNNKISNEDVWELYKKLGIYSDEDLEDI